jgi:hypothetical protein
MLSDGQHTLNHLDLRHTSYNRDALWRLYVTGLKVIDGKLYGCYRLMCWCINGVMTLYNIDDQNEGRWWSARSGRVELSNFTLGGVNMLELSEEELDNYVYQGGILPNDDTTFSFLLDEDSLTNIELRSSTNHNLIVYKHE